MKRFLSLYHRIILVLLCLNFSQITKAQFDFAAMERANLPASERAQDGILFTNDKGESFLLKAIVCMFQPSYCYITIHEGGKMRTYRPIQKDNFNASGDHCKLSISDGVAYLDTPFGSYACNKCTYVKGGGAPANIISTPSSTPAQAPKYKPLCQACNGTGKCGTCHGTGTFRGYEGQLIACPNCSASNGRICNVCGGLGHW